MLFDDASDFDAEGEAFREGYGWRFLLSYMLETAETVALHAQAQERAEQLAAGRVTFGGTDRQIVAGRILAAINCIRFGPPPRDNWQEIAVTCLEIGALVESLEAGRMAPHAERGRKQLANLSNGPVARYYGTPERREEIHAQWRVWKDEILAGDPSAAEHPTTLCKTIATKSKARQIVREDNGKPFGWKPIARALGFPIA